MRSVCLVVADWSSSVPFAARDSVDAFPPPPTLRNFACGYLAFRRFTFRTRVRRNDVEDVIVNVVRVREIEGKMMRWVIRSGIVELEREIIEREMGRGECR